MGGYVKLIRCPSLKTTCLLFLILAFVWQPFSHAGKWGVPDAVRMEEGGAAAVDVDAEECHPFACFGCSAEEVKSNVKFCCNPKWCKPTLARAGGVATAGAIAGAAGILFWQFGIDVFNSLAAGVGAFVVINGTESALSLAALFLSNPVAAPRTSLEELRKLAIVIPVHGQRKNLQPTLRSLMRVGIEPEQIFIMENTGGKYAAETSAVRKTIAEGSAEFSRINYRLITEWASKVAAEYLGASAAKLAGYQYVMAIDDDVIMPDDFDPYLGLIDHEIKMIAFPITPSNDDNLLTRRQKNEYHRADRHNYFKQLLRKTTLSVHGAVSLADLDTYLDVMRHRPVDGAFAAEDQKKGAAFRWAGHKIAMAPGAKVKTQVPSNLCAFWNQRAYKWNVGAQLSNGMYAEDLLTDCPNVLTQDECIRFPFYKLYQLQILMANFSDCVRPLIMVSLASDWRFWAATGVIWEFNTLLDIADDVFFEPHRRGEAVCGLAQTATSCVEHHSSVWYTGLQMIQGSVGALCACFGAGTASEKDFPYKMKYPPEFQEILDIKNPPQRMRALTEILDGVAPIQRARPAILTAPAATNVMGFVRTTASATQAPPPQVTYHHSQRNQAQQPQQQVQLMQPFVPSKQTNFAKPVI